MSSDEADDTRSHPELEHLIITPTRDLGGFEVRRALPTARVGGPHTAGSGGRTGATNAQ